MTTKSDIVINYASTAKSVLTDCPLIVFKEYIKEKKVFSFELDLRTDEKMTPAMQEHWYPLLDAAKGNDLAKVIMQKRGQGAKSNGYRAIETAYQDQGISLVTNPKVPTEVYYTKTPEMMPYLQRPSTNEDVIVGKVLRGVPVVAADPEVEMAQSVIELAFAFVKIVKQLGKPTEYVVHSTKSYYQALEVVFGLKPSFIKDMHSAVARTGAGFEDTLSEPFGTDSIKNARLLQTRLLQNVSSVIRFAVAISNVLFQHCPRERRLSSFAKVSVTWADKGVKPVLWAGSWGVPVFGKVVVNNVKVEAYEDFQKYTIYLQAFQELRSKSDKYSDKVYRMPVGDLANQLHLENAIRIRDATGKAVCLVGDSGAMVRIAWAIHHHKIHGVTVDLTTQYGKVAILNAYVGRPDGCIMFKFTIHNLIGLTNDKKVAPSMKWKEVCEKHEKFLSIYQPGHAILFKSFYFPVLDGVKYIIPAEPHNGSIIALIMGPVTLPASTVDLTKSWGPGVENSFRKSCLQFSKLKTSFCLSRENTWLETPLRTPFFTGPPLALIMDAMNSVAAMPGNLSFERDLKDIKQIDASDEESSDGEDEEEEKQRPEVPREKEGERKSELNVAQNAGENQIVDTRVREKGDEEALKRRTKEEKRLKRKADREQEKLTIAEQDDNDYGQLGDFGILPGLIIPDKS